MLGLLSPGRARLLSRIFPSVLLVCLIGCSSEIDGDPASGTPPDASDAGGADGGSLGGGGSGGPAAGLLEACADEGQGCDDGDCCTSNDTCKPCEGPGCPETGLECLGVVLNCDDSQDCTTDLCACDDGVADCTYETALDGAPCDYSAIDCTNGDVCQGGQCMPGAVIEMDDDNPCTQDVCVKGNVEHQPLNEGQCNDGNECTADDVCYLGTCVGGPPLLCEVPSCASSASCEEGVGCVAEWMPAGVGCGGACTHGGTCSEEHVCVGSIGTDCDDGNPCTDDTCDDVSGGCEYGYNLNPCEDGDDQTCGDVCLGGLCLAGEPCLGPLEDGEGETCDFPIDLGDGGVIDVDLCDFEQDYDYGWCGNTGPELIFTLNVNYGQGKIVMSTAGSFPGILVNYRWWSLEKCEAPDSYQVNGFCYEGGPAQNGWGGYDPDWKIYFAVGSTDGSCGPVKITASTAGN